LKPASGVPNPPLSMSLNASRFLPHGEPGITARLISS
jgi:hypothetical protein